MLFRGQRISRHLLEKELEHELFDDSMFQWYHINKNILSSYMLEKFHQFDIDEDVKTFLINSHAISNSLCLQIFYTIVTSFLSILLTKTNVNGILGRGGMHIFSLNQLKDFLNIPVEWISHDKRLLDLGAGDGQVTAILERLYNSISVTEASCVMEWRLRRRGYTVIPMDNWHRMGTYHLISALNLLDRHYNPSILLTQLHSLTLRSNSLLLLAVVLPLNQYVEFHPCKRTNLPDKIIFLKGQTFEEQAESIARDILEPAGFHVLKWSKVPYLSEGDFRRPFYHLDDALFLLKPVNIASTSDNSSIYSWRSLSSSNRDFISL